MSTTRPDRSNPSIFSTQTQFKPVRPRPKPSTGFRSPYPQDAEVEPTYQRPIQPAVKVPLRAITDARKPQATNSVDSIIVQRQSIERYADLFTRVERMLTLPYAANTTLLQHVDELHKLTKEIHEKSTNSGIRNETEVGQMDAYGTQLWNVSTHLVQTAGDTYNEDVHRYVAKIRRIACMQLELGVPLPLESQTASRLLVTVAQTASMWVKIEIDQAQVMLERCVKWVHLLVGSPKDQLDHLASEAVTSYYCAKYAFVRVTNSGIPESELEKAVKYCSDVPIETWAFSETINHCLEYAQHQFKVGTAAHEDSETRCEFLQSARTFFVGAFSLMDGHQRFNDICMRAGMILAHCCYELAQATGSKEEYEEAFHVLEEREKWLQDKDDKRILAQSILLRLEIMEEMKAKPEDMLVLWEQYSQFKEVKTEDVRRIIRIVTAREKERLLQGSYAFKVVHLIVDAILWRREGEIQKMVAKLLLTMFSFIQDEEDIQSVKQTLKLICVAEFTLAEDVIFACQSALFSLGEERKEASLIMLAGHEVFYKAPVNVAKAYQKAGWMYIEMGRTEDALEALRAVPININEASTISLGLCIIHIRQGKEAFAIESLKTLLDAKDFCCTLLTVIIKEAQDAKMMNLLKETLHALTIKAQDDESASKLDIPVILRTILKLQLDAAERNGGLTHETCNTFYSMVQLAYRVVSKVAKKNPLDEQCADIVTWLYKTTYAVCNDDKHIITPAARCDLARLALELFACRLCFEKSTDDESFHISVWASIHILTAQASLAKKVEKSSEQDYHNSWFKVIEAAQMTQYYLEEAKRRNKGGIVDFTNIETATDIVLVEALANVKQWEEVASSLLNRKGGITPDALEAITHIVCNDKTSPIELKIILLREVNSITWNSAQESMTSVARFASWFQILVEVHLQDESKDRVDEVEYDFNAICNELSKNLHLRRKWPRESMTWMFTECFNVGIKYLYINTDKAEALLATAVRLAELDGHYKESANRMKRFLDHYKAEKDAAAAASSSYT